MCPKFKKTNVPHVEVLHFKYNTHYELRHNT